MPASILGSIPIILIILGSIPGIDLATFLGSMAAARDLGSNPICAMRLGSLSILGSSAAGIDLATFFGSKAAARVFGSSPICARTLGSIPLIMLGSIPAAASIFGSMPATKSADLEDELGGGNALGSN